MRANFCRSIIAKSEGTMIYEHFEEPPLNVKVELSVTLHGRILDPSEQGLVFQIFSSALKTERAVHSMHRGEDLAAGS
jgi:hypothetical protein